MPNNLIENRTQFIGPVLTKRQEKMTKSLRLNNSIVSRIFIKKFNCEKICRKT